MERYGSDKPDLRFDMHIGDVSHIVAHTEFGVFKNTVEARRQGQGHRPARLRRVLAPGAGHLTELAQSYGAKGLLSMALSAECPSIEDLQHGDGQIACAPNISTWSR